MVKNLPTNAGGARDIGSITWFRKSLGVGNGNQFQYSCLGNPKARGAWRATVHGVADVESRSHQGFRQGSDVISLTFTKRALWLLWIEPIAE